MNVAGIDGTKGGWVALVLEDGWFVADHVLSPVETDFSEVADAAVVAVDVAIGFGPRKADAAARAFLTGAASTVFTTPSREILQTPFRPGLGVSAQAHALGRRRQILSVPERLPIVHRTRRYGLRSSPPKQQNHCASEKKMLLSQHDGFPHIRRSRGVSPWLA